MYIVTDVQKWVYVTADLSWGTPHEYKMAYLEGITEMYSFQKVRKISS